LSSKFCLLAAGAVVSAAASSSRTLEQVTPYGRAMIQADQLEMGPAIPTICIVSTGIDLSTGDFDSSKVNGNDNLDRWWDPLEWDKDVLGFGTHLAGIVAAQDNSVGTVGVNPNFDLYIVRGLSDETAAHEQIVMAAVKQCVDNGGAKLVVMGTGSRPDSLPYGMQEFYESMRQQGVLIVAGSGNEGQSSVDYPARFDSVLAVGGVMEDGSKWSGSATGGQVKLAGPAYQVVSTSVNDASGVEAIDGTASSAAYVTAAVGLVWSHFEQCTVQQVATAIQKTATNWNAYSKELGYGIPQVKVAYNVLAKNGCDLSNYDHSTYVDESQVEEPPSDEETPSTDDDEEEVLDSGDDYTPPAEQEEEESSKFSSSSDDGLSAGVQGAIAAVVILFVVLLAVIYFSFCRSSKPAAAATAQDEAKAATADEKDDVESQGDVTDEESNAHSVQADRH
jgi:serine protease